VPAGLGLLAQLTQEGQAPSPAGYQTTTHLDASVGLAATALEGAFALESGDIVQSGVISGSNQGRSVHVNAMPLPGSGTGTGATISGAFGSTPLALLADLPSGGPGSVVGTVDARKVRFDVTNGLTTTGENFSNLRVTGNDSGPADSFALITGGCAYFAA